jgi:hypothetical protein
MMVLADWWRNVKEKEVSLLVRYTCAYACIWAILAALTFDRFTTINSWTPWTIGLTAVGALIGGVFAARAWFGLSGENLAGSSRSLMRLHNRLGWVTRGTALVIIIAVGVAWTTEKLAGGVAQHLPGLSTTAYGTVAKVHEVGTPATPCRIRLTVDLRTSEHITFCLVVSNGRPIGPLSIEEGDNVIVESKSTPFGNVVERVAMVTAT